MGYKRAEEILPQEIIELIQHYVDGENIYIPRKAEQRKEWGTCTNTRQELQRRNDQILMDFQQGYKVSNLVEKYFLSEKSIQRILRESRSESVTAS